MSRNYTEYHVLKRDDEGFLDSVRMCKTFDRAKRVLAVTGADAIAKWRLTPSGAALTTAYPVKQRRDSLKKLYRKHARREADAKKRIEQIKRREAAARVADVMARFWNSWDTWRGGEKA
jgi:alanyl-tRNA synthetase